VELVDYGDIDDRRRLGLPVQRCRCCERTTFHCMAEHRSGSSCFRGPVCYRFVDRVIWRPHADSQATCGVAALGLRLCATLWRLSRKEDRHVYPRRRCHRLFCGLSRSSRSVPSQRPNRSKSRPCQNHVLCPARILGFALRVNGTECLWECLWFASMESGSRCSKDLRSRPFP
jgi:hypothetical protein